MTLATSFENARTLFDLPADLTYLDAAALGPLPVDAAKAGNKGLEKKLHPWTMKSGTFFDDTRSLRPKLAGLLDAHQDCISFVPAVSYGLAIAAQNLPVRRGSKILILAEQFPSNVYTWRRLAQENSAELITVSNEDGQSLTDAMVDAIDDQVSLIATAQVRWTDGALIDAERVANKARACGAATVFDLTQSCGVLPFDTRTIQPDFAVAAGYKWLLGPYSLGFLYSAPKWHDGRPLEENWISRKGSTDFTRLIDYTDTYDRGALRYDVGERANFTLLPALESSVDLISSFGVDRISTHLRTLSDPLAVELEEIGFTCLPPDLRPGHYLAARLPENAPPEIPRRLAEDDIYISQRGDWLRISPHIYNTPEDMDRCLEAITALLCTA